VAQEQVQKQHRKTDRSETVANESTNGRDKTADQVKADTDALLDEIDDLLAEQDAAAFVASYVQKGGE
jgi:ubiquitin-like protein Pup